MCQALTPHGSPYLLGGVDGGWGGGGQGVGSGEGGRTLVGMQSEIKQNQFNFLKSA